MRVAIQGQEASYHHIAAEKYFGKKIDIVANDTFKDVFSSLEDNKADRAVIAVENSLYGTINPVHDLLLKKRFWIIGEVYLRIEHCLIGLPGANKSNIKEIYSQIMALAQCENYLEKFFSGAKHIEHHDTVASVELIKTIGDNTKAAIASERAANHYGLKILDKNIEDEKHNATRFVVLNKKPLEIDKNANKTSLVLITNHQPGSLYNALGAFKKSNVNLTKLQSRPVLNEAWRYMFYIDADASVESANFKNVLNELKEQGCETIVLGNYPKNKQEDNE